MAKLTMAVTKKVATLITRGWSTQNICNRVGISFNSYHKWLSLGTEILDEHNNEKQKTLDDIEENTVLTDRVKRTMKSQVCFAYEVTKALGDQKGMVEESAYLGALEDPKSAISWLERRDADTWAKRTAPPVIVEMQPIKQIVIHPPETKQLTEPTAIDVEFEDV